ncbi:hypothetical protein BJX68DRAFT_266698 [Aspergillus pseudodeflectus]|uniref:Uncharacterized protein n=1 Tax=Aspergillus pseudodeflectus TaxID=176178 RepID=A0ABR4KDY4_9EURO
MRTNNIWQRIDIFSLMTGVSALLFFNFAWKQGPAVGRPTRYTYTLMITGIALFAVFVLVEKRVSTHPLIPSGSSHLSALFTVACLSAGWLSFDILVFYAANLLETLRALTVMLIAMTAFLTGAILLGTVRVHQTYWAQTLIGILFLPWRRGISFPAATIIMHRAIPLQMRVLRRRWLIRL